MTDSTQYVPNYMGSTDQDAYDKFDSRSFSFINYSMHDSYSPNDLSNVYPMNEHPVNTQALPDHYDYLANPRNEFCKLQSHVSIPNFSACQIVFFDNCIFLKDDTYNDSLLLQPKIFWILYYLISLTRDGIRNHQTHCSQASKTLNGVFSTILNQLFARTMDIIFL